jgi:hypothetical protein
LQQSAFGAAGGLTPAGAGGLNYFQNMLGATDPSLPGLAQNAAAAGLHDVFQPFNADMARTALDPARKYGMDMFQQDVMPAIMEKYGPASGAKESGAMWREMGRAGGNLAGGLGAELGKYIFPACPCREASYHRPAK